MKSSFLPLCDVAEQSVGTFLNVQVNTKLYVHIWFVQEWKIVSLLFLLLLLSQRKLRVIHSKSKFGEKEKAGLLSSIWPGFEALITFQPLAEDTRRVCASSSLRSDHTTRSHPKHSRQISVCFSHNWKKSRFSEN